MRRGGDSYLPRLSPKRTQLCITLPENSSDLPDLEQHFRTHAEETVDYPEGEDHGHAVDKPAR